MKNTIKTAFMLVALFVFSMIYSCKDDWNEHYDRTQALPDQNLYELIKGNSSLSTFAKLLSIAGCDSLLTSTQSFTIWAPSNEALANVDVTDIEQVRLLVNNHIARFNHSTSEPTSKIIRMINGKVYFYAQQDGLTFGGSHLLSKDQLAKNGILHTIDNQILYAYNIFEYITTQSNTTKISAFLSKYIREIKEEQGYDTITTLYNPLLEDILLGLGNIAKEDSTYTMIIPTNAGWDAAYARISPYFNVYHADAAIADSIKVAQTSLAIISDLIYRERVEDPANHRLLVSTSGSLIEDVNDLFMGTKRINASNGIIYSTDEVRYDNTKTWNKPLLVESEDQQGRLTGSYTSLYTRTVGTGSIIDSISGNRYIEVQPTNTSAQPYVVFDIPNVLSGKYNIYADFIPAIIDGASMANDSTKLSFRIIYMDTHGKSKDSGPINSDSFVTSGTKKVRIKISSGFQFPISNYYDSLWMIENEYNTQQWDVTTKLRITTNVSSKQLNDNIFTRKFRVDRIIFEPIRN